MNPSELIRDKPFILSLLVKCADGSARVKEECRIYVPSRYVERGLAVIGADTYICGIYPIVSNGKYAVMVCNAMTRVDPAVVNRVNVRGDEYLEFIFPKNSVMYLTTKVVRINTLTYRIFDYFHANARVPWYIEYNQLARLYSTASEYADANIGANHETDELLASVIARNPNNRQEYYRQSAQTDDGGIDNQPVYVSLKNVAYSATNTMSKLNGNHFTDATVSALVSPTTRVEPMERLILA